MPSRAPASRPSALPPLDGPPRPIVFARDGWSALVVVARAGWPAPAAPPPPGDPALPRLTDAARLADLPPWRYLADAGLL
jgi:hypothetical protein